ncbi:hypothetical protein LOTGIDRAFT_167849 [Lottia gigantea]|uniref:SGNH domain-containing protein n=1 Tax=Lottia gigantea TaxID=225164 RepID=V3ZWE0_LOTGI|nr:hypothetical protein LOTGIDRAFT_167849 [Lottia gigantea]ESO85276.1 hypothetical protein LOTGIDRAFT_167849 [Lottia gigantea]
MTNGRWHQNPMTRSQKMDINKFLIDAATKNKLPITYQRADKKCGNVTFDHRLYFRAICDRDGATPCCYNNQCVNRTVEQCRCPNCYDLRDVITPEYADWIPTDPRCAVKKIDYKDACELLSGYTLTFLGDSIIRQIYTAFLIYIRNNYIDGAIQSTRRDIQYNCLRYRMFGEDLCRTNLDRNAKACDGKLQLRYQRIADKSKNHKQVMLDVMKIIPHEKSLLIFGSGGGISDFNPGHHIETFLKPVMDLYKSLKKPYRLLWIQPSYFNIIKKPFHRQTNDHVQSYIDGVVPYLKSQGVPIMNFRDITKGILSHDGLHSSLGMNLWKSHILMNYIQELYNKREWWKPIPNRRWNGTVKTYTKPAYKKRKLNTIIDIIIEIIQVHYYSQTQTFVVIRQNINTTSVLYLTGDMNWKVLAGVLLVLYVTVTTTKEIRDTASNIQHGLSLAKEIGDFVVAKNFTNVIGKLATAVTPFLGIVGPFVSFIMGFFRQPESAELKAIKRLYTEVDNRFDKVDLQFIEVKQLIDWSKIQIQYSDIEQKINAANGVFECIYKFSTGALNITTSAFVTNFDNDYQNSGIKLYDGIMNEGRR